MYLPVCYRGEVDSFWTDVEKILLVLQVMCVYVGGWVSGGWVYVCARVGLWRVGREARCVSIRQHTTAYLSIPQIIARARSGCGELEEKRAAHMLMWCA